MISITYLNGPDVERLALTDDEILAAVGAALGAQGRGETVIEPRVHLVPESSAKGHFNILRGFVKPLGVAGVKVVGDFVENWRQGLPSEMALLNLFSPETGMTNRKPRIPEVAQGRAALRALLDCFTHRLEIFAVGKVAQDAIAAWPEVENAGYIRHPSMGGEARFREGFRTLVASRL